MRDVIEVYAHMVTPLYQVRAQVRAHKSSSACHQDSIPFDPRLGLDDGLVALLHLYLLHSDHIDVSAHLADVPDSPKPLLIERSCLIAHHKAAHALAYETISGSRQRSLEKVKTLGCEQFLDLHGCHSRCFVPCFRSPLPTLSAKLLNEIAVMLRNERGVVCGRTSRDVKIQSKM